MVEEEKVMQETNEQHNIVLSENDDASERVMQRRKMWIGETGNNAEGLNNARHEDSQQSMEMGIERHASRTRIQGEEDNAQAEEELKGKEDRSISLKELYLFQRFKSFLTKGKGKETKE
ncbi:hypothetical protein PIB30_080458 [Stylosanthes scabra]|uniref:Uncharacterized protein n=1 Tax=Stylosanthes scabra TaxID=79078 RepID=A0ABU6TS48_9FABA|nr:hypothetical protein [Stylosanthes scabra]